LIAGIVYSVTKRKIIRFSIGFAFGVALLLLICLNAVLVWVATGPRTLPAVTSYLEKALSPSDSAYRVRIGETVLIWDGWRHPVDLRLRNVEVVTSEGQTFATFPDISLGLDVLYLAIGRVVPTSLAVRKPIISLYLAEDGTVRFGLPSETAPDAPVRPEGASASFAAILSEVIKDHGDDARYMIRRLALEDADISIGNATQGIVMKAQNVSMQLRRTERAIRVAAEMDLVYGTPPATSRISLAITLPHDQPDMNGKLQFTQLRPSAFASLVPHVPQLAGINLDCSGWADITLDREGHLLRTDAMVSMGPGTLALEGFDTAFDIKALEVGGTVTNGFTQFSLKRLHADLNGPVLSATGGGTRNGDDITMDLRAELEKVPGDDVHKFWPVSEAPISREWVTQNVKGSTIKKAYVSMRLQPGDMALPELPARAVDSAIEFTGATVRYLPGHPPLTQVDGIAKFTGKSMDVSVRKAHFLSSTALSDGRVHIENLNEDNPLISVTFKADAIARDIAEFLRMPPLAHADRLRILPDAIEGRIKGQGRLGFYYFAPRDEHGNIPDDFGIDFSVDAEVSDVTQAGFLNKFDITKTSGNLHVDNDKLVYSGKSNVNGVDGEVTVEHRFGETGPYDTTIKAIAPIIPTAALPRFGVNGIDFVQGEFGFDGTIEEGPKNEKITATLDLTPAIVDIRTLSWSKPAGHKATLALHTERSGEHFTIPAFTFEGDEILAKGSMALSQDLKNITSLQLSRLLLGRHDLETVTWEERDGMDVITAKGRAYDYRKQLEGELGNFAFTTFPPTSLTFEIDRIYLANDKKAENVRGMLHCNTQICAAADITGLLEGETKFSFAIRRDKNNRRQLAVHSDDAGTFLSALDLKDGITGGILNLTGTYDDTKPTRPLRGRFDMSEHTIEDAPILARVLTLASLSGIVEAMQGRGIAFTRMNVPFTLEKDVITLKDAKSRGDSLGLTADGTITYPGAHMDIEGTVVPAYALNTVFGKVPVIGEALVGGKGEGVFAARYRVKGTPSDPNVSVNPLSMLTPGFLRGLFDIFDGKQPDKPVSSPKRMGEQ